jgi:hypothetical protein
VCQLGGILLRSYEGRLTIITIHVRALWNSSQPLRGGFVVLDTPRLRWIWATDGGGQTSSRRPSVRRAPHHWGAALDPGTHDGPGM